MLYASIPVTLQPQSHPPSPAVTWMSFLSKESKDFSAPGGWKVDENQILEKPQQLHDARWGRHTVYTYIYTYRYMCLYIFVCIVIYTYYM